MYDFAIISFGEGWAYGDVIQKVGTFTFSKRALVNITGEGIEAGVVVKVPKEFVRFQEKKAAE
jgi:hypothetical protein